MKRTALAATLILLAGCATDGAQPRDVCAPWRPIYVGIEDVLTRQTAERILAHNETGLRLACWEAPR